GVLARLPGLLNRLDQLFAGRPGGTAKEWRAFRVGHLGASHSRRSPPWHPGALIIRATDPSRANRQLFGGGTLLRTTFQLGAAPVACEPARAAGARTVRPGLIAR